MPWSPGAVVQAVVLLPLLGLQALVHPQGDVGGLLVDGGEDGAGVAVKAELGPVIADVPHHLPGDLGDVHIAAGGDLPHHVDQAGGHRGLTGHPGLGVLGQNGVQHRVGDLVADLVGVPLGDRFGSKQSLCHSVFLSLSLPEFPPRREGEKNAPPRRSVWSLSTLIFRYTAAGFGTLRNTPQVAGLHRAVPSTALDKVIQFYNQLL